MTQSRQQYIDNYAEYAMEQMRRYGIPASITLAQGIIESADGKSTLANTANNHFGVKGSFNGNYVLADDDKPNEKFKKYDNVGQSYEDHSKVLTNQRYQRFVKNLAPDDYKGWASGIQKGGYASSKAYVSTVVSVIEGCGLQKYDKMVMNQMKSEEKQFGVASNPLTSGTTEKKVETKDTGMNLPQGEYSMPVKREEFLLVTSPYGKREDPIHKGKTQIHHGIDIKTHSESVLATENGGKVIGVDNRTNTGGGKTLTVEYERADGSKTQVQYMHLSRIDVKKGDTVNAGQKLGVSGNTGTRTTGEHLHLGVINVTADKRLQWVNPAAYLAELNQKGNLKMEAQYNGKHLLAQYQPKNNGKAEQELTPESWMTKLLGSSDSALGGFGNAKGQGLLESLIHMLVTMLLLTMQMEGKSKDEKMQAVSDALVDRKIDIGSLVPNFKSASLSIGNSGSTMLTVNDGKQEYKHELSNAEQSRLSQILNGQDSDEVKRQKIGSMVNAITFSQQASRNYEQIESLQQSQQQTIQRK